MQVRHLPDRDRRNGGVTTLKYASARVPRSLTGSEPPISDQQLPFTRSIAQTVCTAHRRAAARNGFLALLSPRAAGGFLFEAPPVRVPCQSVRLVSQSCADLVASSAKINRNLLARQSAG